MEQQNSSIKTKLQPVNSTYMEVFNLLKKGGRKMAKDIHKTREAKFCHEVQMIREELRETLDLTNPAIPEIKHIRILANAIKNAMSQLDETRIFFHSKGLWKIRESAAELLKDSKGKMQQGKKKQTEESL